MNKLETVLEIVNGQHLNATVEDDRYIVWKNSLGKTVSINVRNIDIYNGKIAWFQSNEDDSVELFRVFENNTFFDFVPKTQHPGHGCDIYLVEWFDDSLIVIYHEKHNVVMSSIKDKNITTFEFYGDELIRRNDLLYFKEYNQKDAVRVLKIPEIIELESISREEAVKKDLLPETLGFYTVLCNKRG
ncbi:putative collagen-binding domain-containing protein [Flavobacterium microcysteis]